MSKDLGNIVRTQEQMQAIARLDAHSNAESIWGSTNANKKSLAECNYPKYPGYDDDLKLVKGSSAFCYHVHLSVGSALVGLYANLSFYDYSNKQGEYFKYSGVGAALSIPSGVAGAGWLNSNIDIIALANNNPKVTFECAYGAPIGIGGAHINLYLNKTWFAGTGTFTVYGWGAAAGGGAGDLGYGKWS